MEFAFAEDMQTAEATLWKAMLLTITIYVLHILNPVIGSSGTIDWILWIWFQLFLSVNVSDLQVNEFWKYIRKVLNLEQSIPKYRQTIKYEHEQNGIEKRAEKSELLPITNFNER